MRVAVALVLLGAALNLNALWNVGTLGLVDDEAHYYLWSRPEHLDYGYYSKPPGIAWVMRGAEALGQWCGMGEATTPVLRTAAVVFSILTGLLSIALARRMFRDDRVGLLVTVLSAGVPMFVVGALLITIDSPMYLCWAASVYCLWRAVEGGPRRWIYLAGAVTGVGMLFKPVLIAIPICAVVAGMANRQIRRRLFNWHGAAAVVVSLASQVLVVVWNANHGWVTFRHLFGQAGMKGGEGSVAFWGFANRMAMYVAGQAGGMGGVMFVLLGIAVFKGWRVARGRGGISGNSSISGIAGGAAGLPEAPSAGVVFTFLLAFTLPLWVFYLVLNFSTTTQINWPAASYFTGMILLAGVAGGFWADGGHKDHRAWKGWIIGTILWGLVAATVVENMQWFYPMAAGHLAALRGTAYEKSWWHPRRWDPAIRLREPEPRAWAVQQEASAMAAEAGHAPTLVAARYNIASSLSFYLPGRPFVYCIGPWIGARQSQYDIWPGLNEKDAGGRLVHAGQDMLLIGDLNDEDEPLIRTAFERVEAAQMKPVMYMGINLRSVRVQRCFGFRGLPVSVGGRSY